MKQFLLIYITDTLKLWYYQESGKLIIEMQRISGEIPEDFFDEGGSFNTDDISTSSSGSSGDMHSSILTDVIATNPHFKG